MHMYMSIYCIYIYILTLQVISRRSGGPRCRGHTLLKPWIKKPKVRVCLRDFFCSNGWDYCKKHNILDSTALLGGFLITTSSSVLRSNHPAKSTHQISIKSAPAAPQPGKKTKGRIFNIEHQHQIKTSNIRQAK